MQSAAKQGGGGDRALCDDTGGCELNTSMRLKCKIKNNGKLFLPLIVDKF